MQPENLCEWRIFLEFGNASPDELSAEVGGVWLRVSPLRSGNRAAAIVVTATEIANRRPRRVRERPAVAGVRSLAHAAGMRLLGRGRQRHRYKIPQHGEKQQKSRSQAMHTFERSR